MKKKEKSIGRRLRFRDDKVHAWVLSRCVPVRPRSAPIKRGVPYAAGVAGRTPRHPFVLFYFQPITQKERQSILCDFISIFLMI